MWILEKFICYWFFMGPSRFNDIYILTYYKNISIEYFFLKIHQTKTYHLINDDFFSKMGINFLIKNLILVNVTNKHNVFYHTFIYSDVILFFSYAWYKIKVNQDICKVTLLVGPLFISKPWFQPQTMLVTKWENFSEFEYKLLEHNM
jgi:hypothetical protein